MDKKDLRVLVAGENLAMNTSIKQVLELFASKVVDIQCEVASIDDAEETIFAGDYTHIIVALVGDDDREKGRIFYNLLKIRLPAWKKNAKLFKASASGVIDESNICVWSIMEDIAAKIILA